MIAIHTMLTITDAVSETINRLDMTSPFLRLVNKLSLRKARRADYAKTIMGGRFIIERANKASRALPGSL